MRRKLLLVALTIATTVVSSFGQKTCGSTQAMKDLFAKDPKAALACKELLENNAYLEKEIVDSTTVYRIPIVFHIIHQYGEENISDAQVMDQMRILNEDFRKLNADTTDIIPEFQPIAWDSRIELYLAKLDPQGNCTNGIEHIYSPTTNTGDDFAKLNQWNRTKYLNIWIVNTMVNPNAAGYAYYPDATGGGFFFADGIIILHDYIGSIGTSDPGRSRALTHEIGHYLSLAHTWGSTNEPEVACGDDGVSDTPETRGHDNCSVLMDEDCDSTIIENVQNFMEYSYCSNMYTKGQTKRMRLALNSEAGGRNNLWQADNLVATGTNVPPTSAPTCIPVSDFYATKDMVCIGDNVQFKQAAWKAAVTGYSWTFQDATPATSTSADPTVSFDTYGWKEVTLTVSNANGSNSRTLQKAIYVSPSWTEVTGPFVQNFDGAPDFWLSMNPAENYNVFQKVTGDGRNGSSCYELHNYRDVSTAIPYSEAYFYYDRLGKTEDYLVTAAYNLSNTSSAQVSFDWAYGTKATAIEDMTEKLILESSRDCGKTWTQRKEIKVTVTNSELLTAGYVGNVDFAPSTDAQWKTATISYSANSTDTKTRFRFRFIASDFSSNLYIDNFNVSGVLGLDSEDAVSLLEVSPNPVSTGQSVNVEIPATTADITLQLTDINGAVISTQIVSANSAGQSVQVPMNVAQGCYFINASKGSIKNTYRVVVF